MDALDKLVACLGKLPGVGRRSAERMAWHLVRDREGLLADLIGCLSEARERVCSCSRCGGMTSTDADPCSLCTNPRRDGSVLCVVEDPNDMILIERSGGYSGRYHALMGKLSPTRGEGFRQLRISSLVQRVESEGFREVVLAMSTDVEGDATASFIADVLKGKCVKVSRLAFGLPARSGVAYADPVTLERAIKWRRAF